MSARYAPHDVGLPPYRPDGPCPKCGHDRVSTHFMADGCSNPDCLMCDREHLRRTCQKCNYQWAEAPIDNGGAS